MWKVDGMQSWKEGIGALMTVWHIRGLRVWGLIAVLACGLLAGDELIGHDGHDELAVLPAEPICLLGTPGCSPRY
jgi:hypothetical protein